MDIIIKDMKFTKLNIKIKSARTLKIIQQKTRLYVATRIIEKCLIKMILNTNKLYNQVFNPPYQSFFYCYEKVYMDDLFMNKILLIYLWGIYLWTKFNETSLPEKTVYSHLNMEGITDADYTHTK